MKDLSLELTQQYYSNISIYYLCSKNNPPQKMYDEKFLNHLFSF